MRLPCVRSLSPVRANVITALVVGAVGSNAPTIGSVIAPSGADTRTRILLSPLAAARHWARRRGDGAGGAVGNDERVECYRVEARRRRDRRGVGAVGEAARNNADVVSGREGAGAATGRLRGGRGGADTIAMRERERRCFLGFDDR